MVQKRQFSTESGVVWAVEDDIGHESPLRRRFVNLPSGYNLRIAGCKEAPEISPQS
ncbi:hypothetical protein Moror_16159 [Moniliophthora roreri MCA 2997]|uniref:Uncharacterized protein n=2 Tax=Moniliophthora roreri TaxID=221103 RepID=V2XAB7_MONRO|nr:hypothetical protein Moror_16159 [Moniliophthora roreri MCA 2997]